MSIIKKVFKAVDLIAEGFNEKEFKAQAGKPEVLRKLLMTREKENTALIDLVKSKMNHESLEDFLKRKL